MIESLSLEVLEEVFHYCSTIDILNVACCSQECYTSVKYILWRKVKIPLSTCKEFSPEIFRNLNYTRDLHLDQGFADGDDNEVLRKGFNSGFSYGRILNSCKPQKLSGLTLTRVVPEGVDYALDVFSCIKKLSLIFSFVNDWEKMCALQMLKELTLEGYYLKDGGLEDLVKRNTLDELHLSFCSNITNDTLISISQASNLTRLSISECNLFSLNIKVLDKLENLTFLNIEDSNATDEDVKHLCVTLKNLKVLKLNKTNINNSGLNEIPSMISLTELQLVGCNHLTGKCFVHLCRSVCLQRLRFSDVTCFQAHPSIYPDTPLSDSVSCLNDMTSLKEIIIEGTPAKFYVIMEALCLEKRWGVKVKHHHKDVNHYILTVL